MAERPCDLCTRPVADAKVCTRCRDGLARDLGDVDALDEQLTIVLCRQTAYAERNGPRSSTVPLPVDMRASEAAWVLRNTLTTWARDLGALDTARMAIHGLVSRRDYGPTCAGSCPHDSCFRIVGAVDNAALSTWLLRNIEDIRHHRAADQIIEEISSAVAMVRNVIDSPAHRTTFPVGPCPEQCAGEIRAYIPASDDVAASMRCTLNPDHAYEPYQWMRAGQRILRKKAS